MRLLTLSHVGDVSLVCDLLLLLLLLFGAMATAAVSLQYLR